MANIKNKFNWRRRLCSCTTREKKKNETTMNVFCIPYTNSAFCSWIYIWHNVRRELKKLQMKYLVKWITYYSYFISCVYDFSYFFFILHTLYGPFMTIHICNIYSAFSSGKFCRLLYLSTCEYRHNGISLLHFYTKNERIFLEKKKIIKRKKKEYKANKTKLDTLDYWVYIYMLNAHIWKLTFGGWNKMCLCRKRETFQKKVI